MRPCDAQLLGDSPNGGNYQDTPPRLLNQSFNQVDMGMTVLEEVRALEMKERSAKTNKIDIKNELIKFKEALKMNEANIQRVRNIPASSSGKKSVNSKEVAPNEGEFKTAEKRNNKDGEDEMTGDESALRSNPFKLLKKSIKKTPVKPNQQDASPGPISPFKMTPFSSLKKSPLRLAYKKILVY
jgi:hypothetical protein